jgi:short-subunit dehydrogenase
LEHEEDPMKGQTILVTGATGGIGRHAALALAAKGHRVIASGRNKDLLAALRKDAPDIDIVPLDVTDVSTVADALVEVDRLTDGRGIDVLVNNAGYGLVGPLAEIDDAKLRDQFEVNVFGLMSVTRAFLPKMMARGSGRILNVSSVSGRISFPLFGAYHATKWALETMSDSLRMELRPFGIHVVVIEPGTIRTAFVERSKREAAAVGAPTSPYAPVYAQVNAAAERLMLQAVGPEVVSNAMIRAIEARSPKARYVAPFHARLGMYLLHAIPTWLSDAVMMRVSGLSSLKRDVLPAKDSHERPRA